MRENEVHIWQLPCAEDALQRLCQQGQGLLSPEEQEARRAIVRPAPARRYLLGRILLRRALAFHLHCDPATLVFSQTENGKLVLERPRPAELDFSLSHSGSATVLAIARARGVGIDLEPHGRGAAVRRIARRAFPASELRQIEAAGAAGDDAALSLWTLKEAAVKAAGNTIWQGLSDCIFDLSAGAPGWLAPPPLGVVNAWVLALGGYGEGHRLAVALWRPAAAGGVVWKSHVLGGREAPQVLTMTVGLGG